MTETENERPEETDRERLTREVRARQKSRNIALGLVLLGMVVLFYLLTLVRFPAPQ